MPLRAVANRIRRARWELSGLGRAVHYGDLSLPPPEMRLGGLQFKDDAVFVESGAADARRLQDAFGLTSKTRTLDLGCGVGRLAIGLLSEVGEMEAYTGVDIVERSISWCKRYVGDGRPGMRFIHLDIANARYRPEGRPLDRGYRLPLADRSLDVIHLYSVFSHMEADDVSIYLREFERLLHAGGGVFLTAFVEDDVEDMAVNPSGYGPVAWSGALHCVRFERKFFEGLVSSAGLRIDRFDHASDTHGQSAIYLSGPG